jgi:hypothetical protein
MGKTLLFLSIFGNPVIRNNDSVIEGVPIKYPIEEMKKPAVNKYSLMSGPE